MESKTYMIVDGKLALVPMEHVEKIVKKEMLAHRAMELKAIVQNSDNSLVRDTASFEFHQIMGKIVRLNRRIPPCVQFV